MKTIFVADDNMEELGILGAVLNKPDKLDSIEYGQMKLNSLEAQICSEKIIS
jgi:uncharacterized protein YegJ (DUF2314 family)